MVSLLVRAAPETMDTTMPPQQRTALHLAAEWGHERCVLALVSAGADASKTDAWGQRARDLFAGSKEGMERLFGPSDTPAGPESSS